MTPNMVPWSSHKANAISSIIAAIRKSLISWRIRSRGDNNKMKLVGVKQMAEYVSHAQIFIFMIISCVLWCGSNET